MKTIDVVAIGEPAPLFELHGSQTIALDSYRGRSHVLIYFMREFACHTCVGHVLELSKAAASLRKESVEVLVIGGGSQAAAAKLAARYKLPFPVLADAERTVYEQYDLDKVLALWQKSGSFLIDRSGILQYIHASGGPRGGLDLAEVAKEIMKLGGTSD